MNSHPDDLKLLMPHSNDLAQKYALGDLGLLQAFVDICRAIEPGLAFNERKNRIEWHKTLSSVTCSLSMLKDGNPRIPVTHGDLLTLKELSREAWRGLPDEGEMEELPFVSDPDLRRICERDLASVTAALKSEDVKPVIVLSGCVTEGVLLDVLLNHIDDEGRIREAVERVKKVEESISLNPRKPRSWKLNAMIDVAGPDGLDILKRKTVEAAHIGRDWRNYVHPHKELREEAEHALGLTDADMAHVMMRAVLRDVDRWVSSQNAPTEA